MKSNNETLSLLAWCVAQFDGASGAGVNHWIQSSEYRRACELIGQELPQHDEPLGNTEQLPVPSPGATGTALAVLRSVAAIIENTYGHDPSTGERLDEEGDSSAADIFEAVCGIEGAVIDAITLLEGGTIEDVNGPDNPAKVLVEVRGGCVEYSTAGNVDVHIIDYDNEPDADIPPEFMGLS